MKNKCIFFCIIFLLVACSNKGNANPYVDHEFKAKVDNVRLAGELMKQGKSKEDTVTATVPTLLFIPPKHIKDVRKSNEEFDDEVAFVIEYFKANVEGRKKDIYASLAPNYREEMKKLINDDSIFKRNTDFFKKNPGITIFGVVKQSDTVSVLVMQGNYIFVSAITILKIDGKLYITNKSPNDMELAIIEASFFKE